MALASEENVAVKEKPEDDDTPMDPQQAQRQKTAQEAQERMEQRPPISTMVNDDGTEYIQQGQNVMDVVTRKAVILSSLGPEYRLAQQFPGVPANVRERHRMAHDTPVAERIAQFKQASLHQGELPPFPSITNTALDFVTANRDLLGDSFKKTLTRLTLRAAQRDEDPLGMQALAKHYFLIDNYISGPFRQMIHDAEGTMGPNFGNLDLESFANGPLYIRVSNYLILKSMVAHWEKKVKDADYLEKNPSTPENFVSTLARGDPRRYLPDPPILFTLQECAQVAYMAQQMTQVFNNSTVLMQDFPPEIRFLEQALQIKGGSPVRQYLADFCAQEEITPDLMREALRRLQIQISSLQTDPYGDLSNTVDRLARALAVGTKDTSDEAYAEYLCQKANEGPGGFESYTFNYDQLSIIKFLDNQYTRNKVPLDKRDKREGPNLFAAFQQQLQSEEPKSQQPFDEEQEYKTPAARAAGRPHNTGWLKRLEEPNPVPMGEIKPGCILD